MGRILIAEDDNTSRLYLERLLTKAGHEVLAAADGATAFKLAQNAAFDAVVTDWMMPNVDGIQLIKLVRAKVKPTPPIMMITALASREAHDHAMNSGADDFIAKPFEADEVVTRLENLLARSNQSMAAEPARSTGMVAGKRLVTPARHGQLIIVAIAASTGGPPVVKGFLQKIGKSNRAAVLLVQHGPKWMLQTFAKSLGQKAKMPVQLVTADIPLEAGKIYLASGEGHMVVATDGKTVQFKDGPAVNFVKPAADPLFESVAAAFGSKVVGVVFTGMGRDGASGCRAIAECGGQVLIQDPETCTVSSMPRSVIQMGVEPVKISDARMHIAVAKAVEKASVGFKRSSRT